MRKVALLFACVALAGAALLLVTGPSPARTDSSVYRSPLDVAFSPDGKLLAVSDHTAGAVVLVDPAAGKAVRQVALKGKPAGVAWASPTRLYVAELGVGSVAEVDPVAGRVLRRLSVGPWPMGLAIAGGGKLLLVANRAADRLTVVDIAANKVKASIPVPRQPYFIAVAPDESLAVVSNGLPAGDSLDPMTSAAVSIIDLKSLKCAADIRLPAGSSAVRQVAVSPDGKWAYAVHTVGRTNLPTTQLERGWVNTNGLSVIDLAARKLYATMLLDQPSEGAANPWGLAVTKDGKTMWISIAGTHQLARVNLAGLHALLAKSKPQQRAEYVNDLAVLYRNDLIKKIRLNGKTPRGVALAPDGGRLAAAAYYSGTVILTDTKTNRQAAVISVGASAKPDQVRSGEMIFHDATYCFQHWLSCSTCHPDARSDGMNWDLLNDGLGNPKNAKSMVWASKTPPMMARGVRANMEAASEAGFRHIQFRVVTESTLKAVEAYLRSLEPVPSPYLVGGKLTGQAERGKVLFDSEKVGCATCHPAGLLTDKKIYDVGTRGPLDRVDAFDTPTLIELWWTGPYLHDGSAATLEEVLTKFNKKGKHGVTAHLSKAQIADLVAYMKSL